MSKASKDKKELTEEQLKKIAGAGDFGSRSSSSSTTSSSAYRRLHPVIHHSSSSSSTSGGHQLD
jgi:hypothetical protein